MARGRPRKPPAADPIDEPIPEDSKDHFSPLLWMSHDEHRVSEASKESEAIITTRSRHNNMQYYTQMEPYLQNLGVQHLVDILESESKSINASLIAGLVERWRPETHTFHLPFGEMTVTLQDVSALWGLPIQGMPVGGISDPTDSRNITINYMLAELLGAEPKIRSNGGKSKYCLDKTKLRAMFARGLDRDSTQLEIERYSYKLFMSSEIQKFRDLCLPPLIPADPEVPRSVIMSLHGIKHSNHCDRDWSEHHSEHYNMAANMSANL